LSRNIKDGDNFCFPVKEALVDKQGICMLIDIRDADTSAGEKFKPPSHLRRVKYVALDERGRVRVDKLYGSATPQNSIDFLKHIMAQVPIPVKSILTGYEPAFNEALIKYLEVFGIQHNRKSPYVPHVM
jgi:hypothetical protein